MNPYSGHSRCADLYRSFAFGLFALITLNALAQAPTITTQPQPLVFATAGQSATLSILATRSSLQSSLQIT